MSTTVLLVTAPGEDALADAFVKPLSNAGYDVQHRDTILPGESIVAETNKLLEGDCPIILCATVKAIGTGWAHQLVNVARMKGTHKILIAKMEQEAYVDLLRADTPVANYYLDQNAAIQSLLAALSRYHPTDAKRAAAINSEIEARYREIALRAYDIIDLANLPEEDRHLAARQLELRKLYVGLRVKAQKPMPDAADKDWFSELEQQRESVHDIERPEAEVAPVPVGSRLSTFKRLIILGDPGAGKSTMIRWIATSYLLRMSRHDEWHDIPDVATLPEIDWLPLVIRCRDLHDNFPAGSLTDAIRQVLKKLEIDEADIEQMKELLLEKIREGKCLLMIDGLDEVPDPTIRLKFCRQVESFHRAYPSAPMIVTSRIVGYREMGAKIGYGFEHLIVSGLTSEDKDEFARRWTAATEPSYRQASAAKELIDAIHSTDRIERLASNPMLLTTMALVKRKIGKLPTKRADLYADAVEVLLNWRSEVDEPLDKHEAIPQLEYIAYAMCERGTQQLREDVALELLQNMRAEYPRLYSVGQREPSDFLKALERRTGILVEAGRVRHRSRLVSVFEFRHLTFQEYLAGLALVDGRHPNRDRSLRLAQRVEPLAERTVSSRGKKDAESWREALRLCVASCGDDDVDDLLRAISQPSANDGQITHPGRALLAAQCLADEPNASAETVTVLLNQIVDTMVLLQGGVKRLKPKRESGWVELRRAAIDLWHTRWASQLRYVILQKLSSTPTNDPTELWDLLGENARHLNSAQIRSRFKVLAAEYRAGRTECGVVLAVEMMNIAFTRRHLRIAGAVPVLFDILAAGPPNADAAIWALGWMGVNPKEMEIPKPQRWIPNAHQLDTLLKAYKQSCSDTRSRVGAPDIRERFFCWLLRANANEDITDAFMERLTKPGLQGRIEAVESLAILGAPQAVDALFDQINKRDRQLRLRSVRAIGEINGTSALARLEALLLDRVENAKTDGELIAAIIIALAKIGNTETFRLISTLIIEEKLKQARSRNLRDIRNRLGAHANPMVLAMANSSALAARRLGTALLSGDDSPEAQNLIRVAARDKNLEIRIAAAEAVAYNGDELDMVILSADLDGDQPFVDPLEMFDSTRIETLFVILRSQKRVKKSELEKRMALISQALGVQLKSPD